MDLAAHPPSAVAAAVYAVATLSLRKLLVHAEGALLGGGGKGGPAGVVPAGAAPSAAAAAAAVSAVALHSPPPLRNAVAAAVAAAVSTAVPPASTQDHRCWHGACVACASEIQYTTITRRRTGGLSVNLGGRVAHFPFFTFAI